MKKNKIIFYIVIIILLISAVIFISLLGLGISYIPIYGTAIATTFVTTIIAEIFSEVEYSKQNKKIDNCISEIEFLKKEIELLKENKESTD